MAVPLDGNALLHRLVRSADPVSIQIRIHVEHSLHIGKHLINHQVILIKHMLRKRTSGTAHHFRTEGTRVNGQHLWHMKGPCILPAKNPVLRQSIGIIDGSVTSTVRMDIEIVGHRQIHAALVFAPFQMIQESREIPTDCIIAVHNLEIGAGGMGQALIDAFAMAAVFLMYFSVSSGM